MSRALIRFSTLLVVACSGRLSFDTHTLPGTGGGAGDETGGLGAENGGVGASDGGVAASGGGSTGGGGTGDCGGSHPLPRPPDADAGEPEGEEPEELECEGESSGCYPCATHLDCAYRWLCDPALLVCVECLTDENCPLGTCNVRLRRCH